jgi:hypothetical protein
VVGLEAVINVSVNGPHRVLFTNFDLDQRIPRLVRPKDPAKATARLRQKVFYDVYYLLDGILPWRIGLARRDPVGTCCRAPCPPDRSSRQPGASSRGESGRDAAWLVQTGVQGDPGRPCRRRRAVRPAPDEPDAVASTAACDCHAGAAGFTWAAANLEFLAAAAVDALHQAIAANNFDRNTADTGT